MLKRRQFLRLSGAITALAAFPGVVTGAETPVIRPFRFCLNTSTISGQRRGLLKDIEIAAAAGYDGVELWINDITDYLKNGNTLPSLAAFINAKGIRVENAISFTEWMVNDEARRKQALTDLEEQMKVLAKLNCHRIAAPPAGVPANEMPDLQTAGARYREILMLGRKYNVMPLLEFWGASGTLYNFGQALAIAAAANDADARLLPDVYHMFRGGSGFDCLKLVNGKVIDIIHMNDYPSSKPANEQNDEDRIYPGDGVAPIKQILVDLRAMGGPKTLSLELFNKEYWAEDALNVARRGLEKMKSLVKASMAG